MKKQMPILLILVGIGLVVFFLYAVFTVGMDLRDMVSANRGTVASLSDAALRFFSENKIFLAVVAAVVVVVKLFVSSPGPARS